MQNKSYLIFEPSNKIHGKWGPNPLLYKMVKRRKLLSFKPLFSNVWGDGSWHKCKIFSSKIMSVSPKIGNLGVFCILVLEYASVSFDMCTYNSYEGQNVTLTFKVKDQGPNLIPSTKIFALGSRF